jgi:hypothetical protein
MVAFSAVTRPIIPAYEWLEYPKKSPEAHQLLANMDS